MRYNTKTSTRLSLSPPPLSSAEPEPRVFVAGNKAVGEKDYKAAIRHYTMAVNMVPEDGVYYSNRSAAYCGVGQYKDALKDAQKCTELKPEWPKGYARKGFAYKGLRCFNLAQEAYEQARPLEDEAQQAKTDAILAELAESITKAGFTKEQEIDTLKQQAKAEEQAAMANAGCSVM